MVLAADEQPATGDLLEMALQAEIGIANGEQLGVDRSVRVVTRGASFAQGVVLKGKGTVLGGVAAGATFILRNQSGPAAFGD